jgi:hypothetical protein
MKGSIFITAAVISFFYFFFKFIEMRFILKENKSLKSILRDTIIVYFSVLTGNFILEQMGPLKNLTATPAIFTNAPDF